MTDRLRAAAIIWGGWLVGSGLVISYAKGIIHPYYVVALAPAIGGLVGVGGTALWAVRDRLWARLVLAGAMLVTTVWAGVLLTAPRRGTPGCARRSWPPASPRHSRCSSRTR